MFLCPHFSLIIVVGGGVSAAFAVVKPIFMLYCIYDFAANIMMGSEAWEMPENDKIQLFEDKRIRTAWDEEKEQTNLNNSSKDRAATGRSTVSYDLFFVKRKPLAKPVVPKSLWR